MIFLTVPRAGPPQWKPSELEKKHTCSAGTRVQHETRSLGKLVTFWKDSATDASHFSGHRRA